LIIPLMVVLGISEYYEGLSGRFICIMNLMS